MMDMEVRNLYWERMFSVIQRSYAIQKHIDFFTWLQDSVNEFVPHDMLLTGWGEFRNKEEATKINYDVASNLKDIHTQSILDAPQEIDPLMSYLYQKWVENNRRWYTLNELNHQELGPDGAEGFSSKLKQLNSLLVYGVSDLRGNNECLYVFFSRNRFFLVQDFVMGMIMPHIDNALRKIQHLAPAQASVLPSELTSRELEIIHWVKSGKTNQEIGMILEISQNTVKSHLKRIFNKLNVSRRAQAVAMLSGQ